ncbi:MAG: hypothetical protein P1P88_01065 [Bacteroidales bacterium]|nr:hypothetical protein [Bacteroidales bacterium]
MPNSFRSKIIEIPTDTIKIDSLSLVPGSLTLFDNSGKALETTDYSVDYGHSLLILNNDSDVIQYTSLKIQYRVLPLDFSKSFQNKDTSLIISNYNPFRINDNYIVKQENPFFADDKLDKNGSISRGFVFGNQRDLGTLSNLNLQLSGKLNDEVSILAAISDNNLPIQPDGNTQKIQEFDKVYVQLYTDKSGIKLGDIELDKPNGYYLNLKKQTRGLNLYSDFDIGKTKPLKLSSELSAGLAKGKYNRVKIDGIEGNQGPYRLLGSNNETYIIVLSGSEKVYINGQLLTRGEKFDYVIDYNSAEMIFTANQPITKDSRIIIEYEYAQQFYPRMQFLQSIHLKGEKSDFWFNFYLEQDNKNDPLSENYNDETKSLMASVGDSIQWAVAPNVRQVDFQNDRVLYQLKDTLLNGQFFDSIYVYSSNPVLASYQLGFSYVGENKGNYLPILSNANGKVYEWVAPENGIPQGAYEPVSLYITPKKNMMASLGGNFKTNANGEAGFEVAVSNLDVNTYSPNNGSDDIGYALKFNIMQALLKADTNVVQLKVFANYQMADTKFRPVENYYDVEFERDWNLPKQTDSWEEQLAGAGFAFSKQNLGFVGAQANYMLRQNSYEGQKAFLNSDLRLKGFKLLSSISFLKSKDVVYQTDYLKHKFIFSKHFKHFTVGVSEETEDNQWQLQRVDSILSPSFKFTEYAVFANEPDSSINKYFLSYRYREDYLPLNNSLQKSNTAKTLQTGIHLLKNRNFIWKTLVTYREVAFIDSADFSRKNDDYLSGRQEINFRLFNGSLQLSAFYETGSGLEIRKQYQYIEVQKGQGQFTWIDYNQNNIKEVDEFELAKFPDEADHIRVFIPSNEYLRAYTTQMSNTLMLQPSRIWNKSLGLRGFLALFSDQFAYRIMQKSNEPNYVPGLSNNKDLISKSLLIRNNFSFKSKNRKWQLDYLFENTDTKSLLISGVDTRINKNHSLKLRWKILNNLTIFNIGLLGKQDFDSEYFSWKNYQLKIQSDELSFQIQPNEAFYTTLSYKYANKINMISVENADWNEVKLIANQGFGAKINLQADFSFVQTRFNGETNSSIAYEMLDGLQNGQNLIWSLSYHQKLSKIFQLSIGYSGRSSEKSPVIHNGNVQLRANF